MLCAVPRSGLCILVYVSVHQNTSTQTPLPATLLQCKALGPASDDGACAPHERPVALEEPAVLVAVEVGRPGPALGLLGPAQELRLLVAAWTTGST